MLIRFRTVTCALLIVSQLTFVFERVAESQIARRQRPTVQGADTLKGLQLKLSEGAATEARPAPVAPAPASKLSDVEAEAVLKRLRPIKTDPDDQKDFALRDRSLPPPRTGKTIAASFPPPETIEKPDSVTSGPLEVLRYSPEGDVPLVPQLSVTFSQPMVAVTSHQDTIAAGVPVKLTPQPSGHWRWVGTKTLLFETDGHFPMATEYTAEIPAGTKAATGATLAASKVWKFTTPSPVLKSSYPNDGPTVRDPLMFVEFDQRIDPSAVAGTIRARSGNHEWKVRVATSEEVAADENVNQLAARATKGRWLAFRVVNPGDVKGPLPSGSSVNVTIGPGTPSAEGPRTTTAAQSFSFRTYGPLRVTEHRCGYRLECTPFDQWNIQFTNPIDTSSFEQSQVRIQEIPAVGKKPEPVSLKSGFYGNTLIISGIKRGRTNYRVTLDPAIRDQFGQALGETAPIDFNVGSAPAGLAGPDKPIVVIDPASQPRLSVYSINHNSLRVRLYSVGPEHWGPFLLYGRNRDNNQIPVLQTPPGKLILSQVVNVQSQPDEMAETRIDLGPALEGGFGQVLVVVEPSIPTARGYRRSVVVWAQVTQIGLDAFVDSSELLGWATSLRDGRPIEGAQLSIFGAKAAGLRSVDTATTGADGTVNLTLPSGSTDGPRILVAKKGQDLAILPENNYFWNDRAAG